jgi:SAM-dependent methyltransferase
MEAKCLGYRVADRIVAMENFRGSKVSSGARKYIKMQKSSYFWGTTDHPEHSSNPEYWSKLLAPLKKEPHRFKDTAAADFGSGRGRNLANLLDSGLFTAVYGVDISPINVLRTRRRLANSPVICSVASGYDVRSIPNDAIGFFMSTITLQHIAPHEIRFRILQDIFRATAPGGLLSFQVGAGTPRGVKAGDFVPWRSNRYDAKGTNGKADCVVDSSEHLANDLEQIGWQDVRLVEGKAWSNPSHEKWLYCSATKPGC